MILGFENRTIARARARARARIEHDPTTSSVSQTGVSKKRETGKREKERGHGAKLDVLNNNIRGRVVRYCSYNIHECFCHTEHRAVVNRRISVLDTELDLLNRNVEIYSVRVSAFTIRHRKICEARRYYTACLFFSRPLLRQFHPLEGVK